MQLIWREARNELLLGLRSGLVTLIFIGLTAYLLMVLTNAGSLQDMGALGVPRNSPSLVYLMTTGNTFFLFFAWAWVFAQPIVRDRQALLHEVVLAAPVSLRTLLVGRYLGALGTALLLGTSQVLGFLLAPLLENLGWVPAGAMGPTPVTAMGWAFLIFTLPTALGIGALYLVAAIKTRSTAGPFAASAVLIFIWMFAMIIMSEGGISTSLSAVLDPSCFAEVDRLNRSWTPVEKTSIVYPLSGPLLLNRLLWCVLPLGLLAIALSRASREHLVMEKTRAGKSAAITTQLATSTDRSLQLPPPQQRWWRAFLLESAWQHGLLLRNRAIQILLGMMLVLGIGAAFVHRVNHVEGPFEARPEVLAPLLAEILYLVIVFIAAALAGHVLRRDQRTGMTEILDAAPAPVLVSLLGRVSAILTLTLLLILTPALAVMANTLVAAPQAFSLITPLLYQLALQGPALLELVAITIFIHCLIRRSGLAHALSMFAAFIFVVNHEAELITYPPFEFGVQAHVSYSLLSGWSPWFERLLVGDGYKLACIALLLACAVAVQVRGFDSRLQHGAHELRRRLAGPAGIAIVMSTLGVVLLYQILDKRFSVQGTYLSRDARLAEDAQWELLWLDQAAPYSVAGGELTLHIDTQAQRVTGEWRLYEVIAPEGSLHLSLPDWLSLDTATVENKTVEPRTALNHAAVMLHDCAASGCDVLLPFVVEPRGWDTEGKQHWLMPAGVWATAGQLAPTLGFDQDRRVLAPVERSLHGLPVHIPEPTQQALKSVMGIAPAGAWQLEVSIDDESYLDIAINGPLDFVVQHAALAGPVTFNGLNVIADSTRTGQAAQVAEDVSTTSACLERRLGATPTIDVIAQLPRGMGSSAFANGTLLLAEEPYWDIGETGTGRWQRQVRIGTLLAQRLLTDGSELRQGAGARAFIVGVAGALGHLCASDHQGTQALQILLSRKTERISQALASAESPVVDLASDVADSWLEEYASIASLTWVAQMHASDLQKLLAEVKRTGDVAPALVEQLGVELTAAILGAPLSSDLTFSKGPPSGLQIQRERWEAGGWLPAPAGMSALQLHQTEQILDIRNIEVPGGDSTAGSLLLDDWPGYERTPEDNTVH